MWNKNYKAQVPEHSSSLSRGLIFYNEERKKERERQRKRMREKERKKAIFLIKQTLNGSKLNAQE